MTRSGSLCNGKKLLFSVFYVFVLSIFSVAQNPALTIFQTTNIPANPRSNDGQPIELGMKFRSAQNGFITGVRYYKGAGTTGTHTGNLWSITGTRLATATFTGETASGWQQVLFATPVAITAGVNYVVSYFSPSGDYAITNPYFTQAVVNGPLRALANGENGPNGLYRYSSTSLFPNSNYQSSNYWVDVVFNTSLGADITPPTVTSVLPVNGATGVSTGTTVIANFSEVINGSTVTGTTFQLRDAGNNIVPASVNTSSSQTTLTPSSALTASTVYTATILAGTSGVKDLAGNALVNNYSWSFTTASIDNTPPTVSSVLPVNGATGVSTGPSVIANFSEAVNASTVTGSTFQLRDAGNNLVSANVNTSSNQITLIPSSALSGSTVYTVTIIGGASGVKDLAGNALVNNYSWSFTTVAGGGGGGSSITIFQTTNIPADPLSNDGQPLELGMKFRSAQNGLITGVRYYKGAGTTGTHTGNLWSSTGTRLATATFTGETASGWQQVLFAAPVAITAGVTYIVSYFSASGDYAINNPYFTQAVVNGPLRALATGEDGPNGLYRYSSTSVFPNSNFQSSNYWVDVVFNTGGAGSDITPPTVTSVLPVSGATGVSSGVSVIANFSEAVNGSTVTGSTFQLRDAGNNLVSANVNTSSNQITLIPSSALSGSTVYTVTIVGGASGVKDLAGNALVNNYNWSFTTAAIVDITPPTVTTVSPINGATGVIISTTVTANFSETINASTVTGATFQLRDAGNNLVNANLSTSSNQVTLTPSAALTNSITYTVTIIGGSSGVKDLAGNALVNNYSWSFTTGNNPPVPQAQAILVITTSSNAFSRYIAEILRAEGLNEFIEKDISQVNDTELNNYDIVILGEMSINSTQANMFTNWVNTGGTFIAFRPSTQLSSLLGITRVTGSLAEGYLLVNTSPGPGAGIVGQTIQYHGTADFYTLNSATSLGTLYSNANTATSFPAVTTRSVGSNGGRAIAFTYDLAKSIIYTRQGNPSWAGQKRDGTNGPIRSDDLFFGGSQPDWIDFNKIAIPQADEHQRLLSNIIIQYNLHRKPLPRFWFLPSGHKAAIVMTGDDHAFNETISRFNDQIAAGPNSAQDVADWKAVRSTSYVYPGSSITNSQAMAFEAQGFEIALHPNNNCSNFTSSSLTNIFSTQLGQFSSQWPGLSAPSTNRTHCLVWSDWSTHPKVERQFGIRLDVNYYYWPQSWMQNRPGMFTGSGMPMRFADLDGSVIDCYQVPTQMTDETNMNYTNFCNQVLDKAIGPEGYYGVFATNMHTDLGDHPGSAAIIASAQARQIPLVSAKQMLTWLDGRNGSFFGSLTWSNNQLIFPITALSGARNLKAMLPFNAQNGQLLSITRNGSSIPFTTQTIKGMLYAFFDAAIGTSNYVASYSVVNGGPVISTQPASQTVCAGNNVTFSSVANGNPAPTVRWQSSTNGTNWSDINGATNSTFTFAASISDNNKQYRAVWTNSGGFVNSNSATLTVKAIPGTPTISVVNNCGNSALIAASFTGSLLWSNGAISPTITVTIAGVYTVTQTVDGCISAPGSGTAAPANPSVATPTVIVVNNCGNSVLKASGFTGSLLWSTLETTDSIIVATAGTYTVTQTVNGCTSAPGSGTAAPANPSVAAPIVNVINNCGKSVLTASGYTGVLLWSTGLTTSSITVDTAGTYTVTQTVSGCTSAPGSGIAEPKAIPTAPAVTVVDSCGVSALTVGSLNGSLLWSTLETTDSITVATAGTYTVTLTVDGCTSTTGSGIATPKAIPSAPIVTVVNNCGNSLLTASGFIDSLLWSTGATTASITVTTAGAYTVTQTENGCTSGAGSGTAAPLNSNVPAPTVTVVNNCGNSELTASDYAGTLVWSNGSTDSSINVATAATYTVTQTVSGCISAPASGNAAPKAIPTAPAVTVIDSCGVSALTVGSLNGSLLWSTLETTDSITVATAGTYTVAQTVNGCTSAPGIGIATPKAIPSAPTVNVVNNCGNSLLTASGFIDSLLWSTGATTASITVTTAGTHTVTRTVNGCTSAPGTGTAAPLNSNVPAPTVTVVNNCGNSKLTASDYSGTLVWSNGSTDSSINVATAATYTVTQTVSGCTSAPGSGNAAPKAIPTAPAVTVIDSCGVSALTVGSLNGSLLWSTLETTDSITVETAGTYTVIQTVDGCTSAPGIGIATPKAIPSEPTVNVINNCGNSLLTASGITVSLLWSTGATTASITVTTAGAHTVTRTVNGCTSAPGTGTAAPLNSNVPAPTVTVVNNCGNSKLTASDYAGTLVWSNGSTDSSINVATAATYTVTQTVSGCTSAPGIGNAAPKAIPTAPAVTVVDSCGTSALTAGSLNGSLLWSTLETTDSITVANAGTYTVTQTVDGCTSTTGSGTATPKAIPSAPTVNVVNNCGNSLLTASDFAGTRLWSNGATTSSITVTIAGTYTVTQTANGCTSAPGSGTAAPLNSNVTAPTVGVVNNCGNSLLTASGFTGTLLWSTGETTESISVTTAGTYTVTQTKDGCTSAAGSVAAAPKTIPVLSSNLAATATSGTAFTYTPVSTTTGTVFAWSRAAISGISNAAASGTGNIVETLVNTTSSPVNVTYVYTLSANGCTNTQNVVITVNSVQPVNCVINGSITSSFNNTAIPAGRYIWFNSVFDRGSFTGVTGPVTFNVTNSKITFTANSQQYTLNVPDARIRFDAAVISASTQFINNVWETAVPRTYTNYVFMSGLSYLVPSNLPGGITNVKWTADVSIDKTGITVAWKWAAAVYTSFAGHAGLNIKPLNGNTQNPYPNSDKAGTPENFKAFVVGGAKGTGGTNYTGSYSGTSTVTCTTTTGQRSSGQPIQQQFNRQSTQFSVEQFQTGKLDVNVMPNPTTNFFNLVIKGNSNGPISVRVLDVFGQVLEKHEKVVSGNVLVLGHKWQSGTYFAEVIQGDQRKVVKIIKAR